MKSTQPTPSNFLYAVTGLLVILLLVSAGGGLTLVWLRQQITETAQTNRRLQNEAHQIERRVRYIDTKIAEVNSPAYLRSRVVALNLQLERPTSRQVIRMQPIDSRPGIPGEQDTLFFSERAPFVQSFDLAITESLRRTN